MSQNQFKNKKAKLTQREIISAILVCLISIFIIITLFFFHIINLKLCILLNLMAFIMSIVYLALCLDEV